MVVTPNAVALTNVCGVATIFFSIFAALNFNFYCYENRNSKNKYN